MRGGEAGRSGGGLGSTGRLLPVWAWTARAAGLDMVSSVGDAIDLVEELRRSVALADGLRIRGVQQVQVALSLHEQPRPKG